MGTPERKNRPTLLEQLDGEALKIISEANGQIVTESELLPALQIVAEKNGFKIGLNDIAEITLELQRKGKIKKHEAWGWKINL